ncbi:unnamed protein product [Zymoseptoria tritici ST99CH_3D1]|nr:unnamed protein product [Zymoseptoria tritici ST99CH_3D1]
MAAERTDGPAEGGDGGGGGGLFDLEKELSCSICTDILHLPLTLLDCLHTFCGPCLKEWFAWQATAARASSTSSRNKKIYTCPSCRDAVRGTKADWRLATLLEGFLKANPGKGKSAEEKEELGRGYVPGEDILVPVEVRRREEGESEDEALVERVREASLANVESSDTARRRARERRRAERAQHSHEGPERRSQEQEVDVARHIEHQPSLRNLLGSDTTSLDVQQEILASIYAEGLLDGVDIDNLTSVQEEELTERIAEAYRRRQRMRERSRNRQVEDEPESLRGGGQRHHERPTTAVNVTRAGESGSSRPTDRSRRSDSSPQQHTQTRTTRPPISRPHLFDQTRPDPAARRHRRSASSTDQRSEPSSSGASDVVTSAARSATDLSSSRRTADPDRPRPRAVSTNARSATDPSMRASTERVRNDTGVGLHPASANNSPRSRAFDRTHVELLPSQQTHHRSRSNEGTVSSDTAVQPPMTTSPTSTPTANTSGVHTAPTHAASATLAAPMPELPPSVSCTRCSRPDIEQQLHYTCTQCPASLDPDAPRSNLPFTLCLQCYRSGAGCHHWFGFGFAAQHRWSRSNTRSNDRPHILAPQKWLPATSSLPNVVKLALERSNLKSRRAALDRVEGKADEPTLLTGAFCEICHIFSNTTYWYCQICADGSWGYCHACVVRGNHCTHPLLPLAHISALPPSLRAADPNTRQFVAVPHLKEHSWVFLPVGVSCDGCDNILLPPKEPGREEWFHCYACNGGDYDLCWECYHDRTATSNQGRGRRGQWDLSWRRCERGHRMVILGTQSVDLGGPAPQGWTRLVRHEMVGGWRLKEDELTASTAVKDRAGVPPDGGAGYRYLALYARFPDEGVGDELTFPRNAEIREAEDLTDEWSIGVFAGKRTIDAWCLGIGRLMTKPATTHTMKTMITMKTKTTNTTETMKTMNTRYISYALLRYAHSPRREYQVEAESPETSQS